MQLYPSVIVWTLAVQQVFRIMYKEANSKKRRQETFHLDDDGADRLKILKMAIEFVQVLESKGGMAEILYSDHTTKVSKEELQ